AEGRPMVLGGVTIPHKVGLLGHSDADVVIHALCDAMLGALALGDIGQHFPDTDAKYRGISSRVLLQRVCGLIAEKGYRVVNADCSIIADQPKVMPFASEMRRLLAEDLRITPDRISIKATTREGTAVDGIDCHSVVLLQSS